LHIVPVLLSAWFGAVLGGALGFAIGRFGGRRLLEAYGRYVGVTEKRLARVDAFFDRYGGAVIVFARFLEIARQINGIIAGAGRMPWQKFLIYNGAGAALWVGVWGLLVYWLGRDSRRIIAAFHHNQPYILLVVLVVLVLWAFFLHHRRRHTP
jgi:membrane protein DedA with SNARE-associated domain